MSDWQQELSRELRDQLPAAAYHESGHAVIAHVCGFTVRAITLRPRSLTEEEYAGLIRPSRPRDEMCAKAEADIDSGPALVGRQPKDRDSLRLWAMSMVAGGLAQSKAFPGSVQAVHIKDDMDRVVHAAVSLIPKDMDFFTNSVRDETQRLLDSKPVWAAVRACADLLLRRGTVTGEELQRMPRWAVAKSAGI